MKKLSKAEIYAEYGIEYKSGKINAPLFGWINPLLKNGNEKLGTGVATFSTLPGTREYAAQACGVRFDVKGTCACNCEGCYACSGRYRMEGVLSSMAINTALARLYPEFVRRAVTAQIKADYYEMCRIHAAGDFFNAEYIQLWKDVCRDCPDCAFWTYTKNVNAENAFDDVCNANIVKSIIPGIGFNFGHCGYIMDVFHKLRAAGKSVHICRCGFDDALHCNACKGCSKNEYVLFVEHSTAYKAGNDPDFPALQALAESDVNKF